MTANRDTAGRFQPGTSGNPTGQKGQHRSTEERIEQLLQKHGANMLDRAFHEAKTDNAVLAGLLTFLASCQQHASLSAAAQLTLISASAGATH